VAINPAISYLLIDTPSHGKLILAESLAPPLLTKLGLDTLKSTTISPADLLTCTYRNPLTSDSTSYPILPAGYVTADSGTGLVHSAPGHGLEDYNLLAKYNVPPFSPVDNEGRYTEKVIPKELRGLDVLFKGNKAVVEMLKSNRSLLHKHVYRHKYPYDWRSKEPVIIRATEQWFANVEGIKDVAIKAIGETKMIPESGVLYN